MCISGRSLLPERITRWKAEAVEHTWQESGFMEWSQRCHKADHSR